MSEFRIFCITTFVTAGLVAATDNHDWLGPEPIPNDSLALLAFFFGCAAVAFFGKRKA